MKKYKIIIFSILIIFCSFIMTACDFEEVHTKIDDKKITLISKETQQVDLKITIEDNSIKNDYKESITLYSDELSIINIEEIINPDFLSNEAKIVDVEITNQSITDNLLFALVMGGIIVIIGVLLIVLDIIL